jgi:hypothetical protein
LPRLGYVLFVKLSEKEVFSQPDVMPLWDVEVRHSIFRLWK